MARKARVKSTSGIYSVLVTGEKNSQIFLNAHDGEKYIELLGEYSDVCGFKLYAYCLMDNHVHLLINENGEEISRIIKRIATSYVHWFNNKYHRQGQLLADRFKSQPIETEEEFCKALKFIHLNPVIAGKEKDGREYRYSSYGDYFSNENISADMARRIFGGVQDFNSYHTDGDVEIGLEISHNENVIADDTLKSILEQEYLVAGGDLSALSRSQQKEIVGLLTKRYKVSMRQLSRVANINLTKLWRIYATIQV